METPSWALPNDAREIRVLKRLVEIRDALLLLKSDRSTYIRSQDVLPLYGDTIDQVKELNQLRIDEGTEKEETQHRVLESCFQLLSLFFMTIGRNNEAPGSYALTSTIRRLLDHLAEADLFSAKDLESITDTLEGLTANLKKSADGNAGATHSPFLITLLSNRLELCRASLQSLQKRLERLDEPLPAIHEKLISLLRSISWANTRSRFSTSEVKKLQAQVQEIDAKRKDGKFVAEDGSVPAGNDEVCDLLKRCNIWADLVLERKGVIPESFRPLYDKLVNMRNELENLSITQAWALRETDLYDFQRTLDKVDESRVDGNWIDEDGKPAELYVQRTLLYLIRRSYGYIYSLMISSEPVSEALLPVYNQLQTLKRCLIEVKNSGGVSSVRELYPYGMKLNSIDNLRTDGKFMVGNDIPEGQGSVSELLNECFELSHELKIAAEDAEEQEA